jgi:hypothetical protein
MYLKLYIFYEDFNDKKMYMCLERYRVFTYIPIIYIILLERNKDKRKIIKET